MKAVAAAISRTQSELHEIVGAELLTRGRGVVALSPQREFFHDFAQGSLSALEQGMAGIEESGREGATQLQLGVLPSVVIRLMPEMVTQVYCAWMIRRGTGSSLRIAAFGGGRSKTDVVSSMNGCFRFTGP